MLGVLRQGREFRRRSFSSCELACRAWCCSRVAVKLLTASSNRREARPAPAGPPIHRSSAGCQRATALHRQCHETWVTWSYLMHPKRGSLHDLCLTRHHTGCHWDIKGGAGCVDAPNPLPDKLWCRLMITHRRTRLGGTPDPEPGPSYDRGSTDSDHRALDAILGCRW